MEIQFIRRHFSVLHIFIYFLPPCQSMLSVLDFFVQGVLVENHKASEQDSLASYSLRSFNGQATRGYVRALTGAELASRMEKSITDADLIEECFFVPATANGWVSFSL